MAASRKAILLLVILCAFGTAVFILGPAIACAYKHYSFASNVQVEIDVSSPMESSSQSAPRRYLFSFEGERDQRSVHFRGDALRYEYDENRKTFKVRGSGMISHDEATIELTPSEVLFNGQQLPADKTPSRILVKRDGRLANGYCELRW